MISRKRRRKRGERRSTVLEWPRGEGYSVCAEGVVSAKGTAAHPWLQERKGIHRLPGKMVRRCGDDESTLL